MRRSPPAQRNEMLRFGEMLKSQSGDGSTPRPNNRVTRRHNPFGGSLARRFDLWTSRAIRLNVSAFRRRRIALGRELLQSVARKRLWRVDLGYELRRPWWELESARLGRAEHLA